MPKSPKEAKAKITDVEDILGLNKEYKELLHQLKDKIRNSRLAVLTYKEKSVIQ